MGYGKGNVTFFYTCIQLMASSGEHEYKLHQSGQEMTT